MKQTDYVWKEGIFMELLDIMKHRRSVRTYNGQPVSDKDVEQILLAGLFSASGRARRPWEVIVVRDKDLLQKLSVCREHGAGMLANADCAIVVLGDPQKTDVWAEDCSIAMANMHLMADYLGVGSCWIQNRLRTAPDGRPVTAYLRELLRFPEHLEAEAILSLGMTDNHPAPHTESELPLYQVHQDHFATPYHMAQPDMEKAEYLQNARFPKGESGKSVLSFMRDSHAAVTGWTLDLMNPQADDVILDIGCGGGRALKRVSSLVPNGTLYGVDYSETAVTSTKEENLEDVASGKLTVVQGSVSALPFPDNTFDKIFSIESYYFWPDLENDLKEIRRVLKPGGKVFITADIHKRENLPEQVLYHIRTLNMTNLSFEEFDAVMQKAGFTSVKICGKEHQDWMCATGEKATD